MICQTHAPSFVQPKFDDLIDQQGNKPKPSSPFDARVTHLNFDTIRYDGKWWCVWQNELTHPHAGMQRLWSVSNDDFAFCAAQGPRQYMEDRMDYMFDAASDVKYFGVYDGHGGKVRTCATPHARRL
jgi:hypothetical protein